MRKLIAIALLSAVVVLSGTSPLALFVGQLTNVASADGGGE